ncbi:hypothetical protein NP233_g5835 [Leucocoprinus birnbaumii]|uniref:Uncharacterized protein n=1 Tax=Leucocoprinus birnbaumii TaxID=56174 RepID=A0AAD5VUT2_9AGAR|nr:hypothetical protein NP233_g5835 [Leucocoprinus birnbaumii]
MLDTTRGPCSFLIPLILTILSCCFQPQAELNCPIHISVNASMLAFLFNLCKLHCSGHPAIETGAGASLVTVGSAHYSVHSGIDVFETGLAGSLVGAVDLTLHAVDRSSFHGCIATPTIKAAVPLRLAVLIVWCCVTAVQVTLTVVKFVDQLNIPVKDHTIHDRFSLFKKNTPVAYVFYRDGNLFIFPVLSESKPLRAHDTKTIG